MLNRFLCLLLAVVIVWLGGCGKDGEALAAAIKKADSTSPRSVNRLVRLCDRLGQEAVIEIRWEIQSSRSSTARSGLIQALIQHDTNENLAFLVDTLAEDTLGRRELKEALQGRLDERSRVVLQELVGSSSGSKLTAVLDVLAPVCDDPESLQIAKSLFERDLSPEERMAALGFLASAAYYNDDSSVLAEVRKHLESSDPGVQFSAFLALAIVPGEEAEALLRKAATELPDPPRPEVLDELLAKRHEWMSVTDRKAPGWRKE